MSTRRNAVGVARKSSDRRRKESRVPYTRVRSRIQSRMKTAGENPREGGGIQEADPATARPRQSGLENPEQVPDVRVSPHPLIDPEHREGPKLSDEERGQGPTNPDDVARGLA